MGIDRGPGTFDLISCVDAGDIDLTPFNMHIAMDTAQRRLAELLADNAAFLMLGGDHSLTLAALRAVSAKHGPLAVLHLDAHSDTNPAFYGGEYHHGTPFRHAIEEKLVDPQRMVQIGIRGHNPQPDSLDYARGHGVHIVTADTFADLGNDAATRLVRDIVGDTPLYVSVDIDVVDPAFAPGTGTPPGAPPPGRSWRCCAASGTCGRSDSTSWRCRRSTTTAASRPSWPPKSARSCCTSTPAHTSKSTPRKGNPRDSRGLHRFRR